MRESTNNVKANSPRIIYVLAAIMPFVNRKGFKVNPILPDSIIEGISIVECSEDNPITVPVPVPGSRTIISAHTHRYPVPESYIK
jgi:hypothetical protein